MDITFTNENFKKYLLNSSKHQRTEFYEKVVALKCNPKITLKQLSHRSKVVINRLSRKDMQKYTRSERYTKPKKGHQSTDTENNSRQVLNTAMVGGEQTSVSSVEKVCATVKNFFAESKNSSIKCSVYEELEQTFSKIFDSVSPESRIRKESSKHRRDSTATHKEYPEHRGDSTRCKESFECHRYSSKSLKNSLSERRRESPSEHRRNSPPVRLKKYNLVELFGSDEEPLILSPHNSSREKVDSDKRGHNTKSLKDCNTNASQRTKLVSAKEIDKVENINKSQKDSSLKRSHSMSKTERHDSTDSAKRVKKNGDVRQSKSHSRQETKSDIKSSCTSEEERVKTASVTCEKIVKKPFVSQNSVYEDSNDKLIKRDKSFIEKRSSSKYEDHYKNFPQGNNIVPKKISSDHKDHSSKSSHCERLKLDKHIPSKITSSHKDFLPKLVNRELPRFVTTPESVNRVTSEFRKRPETVSSPQESVHKTDSTKRRRLSSHRERKEAKKVSESRRTSSPSKDVIVENTKIDSPINYTYEVITDNVNKKITAKIRSNRSKSVDFSSLTSFSNGMYSSNKLADKKEGAAEDKKKDVHHKQKIMCRRKSFHHGEKKSLYEINQLSSLFIEKVKNFKIPKNGKAEKLEISTEVSPRSPHHGDKQSATPFRKDNQSVLTSLFVDKVENSKLAKDVKKDERKTSKLEFRRNNNSISKDEKKEERNKSDAVSRMKSRHGGEKISHESNKTALVFSDKIKSCSLAHGQKESKKSTTVLFDDNIKAIKDAKRDERQTLKIETCKKSSEEKVPADGQKEELKKFKNEFRKKYSCHGEERSISSLSNKDKHSTSLTDEKKCEQKTFKKVSRRSFHYEHEEKESKNISESRRTSSPSKDVVAENTKNDSSLSYTYEVITDNVNKKITAKIRSNRSKSVDFSSLASFSNGLNSSNILTDKKDKKKDEHHKQKIMCRRKSFHHGEEFLYEPNQMTSLLTEKAKSFKISKCGKADKPDKDKEVSHRSSHHGERKSATPFRKDNQSVLTSLLVDSVESSKLAKDERKTSKVEFRRNSHSASEDEKNEERKKSDAVSRSKSHGGETFSHESNKSASEFSDKIKSSKNRRKSSEEKISTNEQKEESKKRKNEFQRKNSYCGEERSNSLLSNKEESFKSIMDEKISKTESRRSFHCGQETSFVSSHEDNFSDAASICTNIAENFKTSKGETNEEKSDTLVSRKSFRRTEERPSTPLREENQRKMLVSKNNKELTNNCNNKKVLTAIENKYKSVSNTDNICDRKGNTDLLPPIKLNSGNSPYVQFGEILEIRKYQSPTDSKTVVDFVMPLSAPKHEIYSTSDDITINNSDADFTRVKLLDSSSSRECNIFSEISQQNTYFLTKSPGKEVQYSENGTCAPVNPGMPKKPASIIKRRYALLPEINSNDNESDEGPVLDIEEFNVRSEKTSMSVKVTSDIQAPSSKYRSTENSECDFISITDTSSEGSDIEIVNKSEASSVQEVNNLASDTIAKKQLMDVINKKEAVERRKSPVNSLPVKIMLDQVDLDEMFPTREVVNDNQVTLEVFNDTKDILSHNENKAQVIKSGPSSVLVTEACIEKGNTLDDLTCEEINHELHVDVEEISVNQQDSINNESLCGKDSIEGNCSSEQDCIGQQNQIENENVGKHSKLTVNVNTSEIMSIESSIISSGGSKIVDNLCKDTDRGDGNKDDSVSLFTGKETNQDYSEVNSISDYKKTLASETILTVVPSHTSSENESVTSGEICSSTTTKMDLLTSATPNVIQKNTVTLITDAFVPHSAQPLSSSNVQTLPGQMLQSTVIPSPVQENTKTPDSWELQKINKNFHKKSGPSTIPSLQILSNQILPNSTTILQEFLASLSRSVTLQKYVCQTNNISPPAGTDDIYKSINPTKSYLSSGNQVSNNDIPQVCKTSSTLTSNIPDSLNSKEASEPELQKDYCSVSVKQEINDPLGTAEENIRDSANMNTQRYTRNQQIRNTEPEFELKRNDNTVSGCEKVPKTFRKILPKVTSVELQFSQQMTSSEGTATDDSVVVNKLIRTDLLKQSFDSTTSNNIQVYTRQEHLVANEKQVAKRIGTVIRQEVSSRHAQDKNHAVPTSNSVSQFHSPATSSSFFKRQTVPPSSSILNVHIQASATGYHGSTTQILSCNVQSESNTVPVKDSTNSINPPHHQISNQNISGKSAIQGPLYDNQNRNNTPPGPSSKSISKPVVQAPVSDILANGELINLAWHYPQNVHNLIPSAGTNENHPSMPANTVLSNLASIPSNGMESNSGIERIHEFVENNKTYPQENFPLAQMHSVSSYNTQARNQDVNMNRNVPAPVYQEQQHIKPLPRYESSCPSYAEHQQMYARLYASQPVAAGPRSVQNLPPQQVPNGNNENILPILLSTLRGNVGQLYNNIRKYQKAQKPIAEPPNYPFVAHSTANSQSVAAQIPHYPSAARRYANHQNTAAQHPYYLAGAHRFANPQSVAAQRPHYPSAAQRSVIHQNTAVQYPYYPAGAHRSVNPQNIAAHLPHNPSAAQRPVNTQPHRYPFFGQKSVNPQFAVAQSPHCPAVVQRFANPRGSNNAPQNLQNPSVIQRNSLPHSNSGLNMGPAGANNTEAMNLSTTRSSNDGPYLQDHNIGMGMANNIPVIDHSVRDETNSIYKKLERNNPYQRNESRDSGYGSPTENVPNQQNCDNCGGSPRFKCSGCFSVYYCSLICQHFAWSVHQNECILK